MLVFGGVCPEKASTPKILFFSDGIGTFKPSNDREGSGGLDSIRFVGRDPCNSYDSPTWMSLCKLGSKVKISGLFHPNIPHLQVGYNPFTNH